MPTEQDVSRLFGVLLAALRNSHSLTAARLIVAKAGITGVNDGGQYWDPFLAAVDSKFQSLELTSREQALRILADELLSDCVRSDMARLGYEYIAGAFVPVEMFDRRESLFVPQSSASELEKAMKRLADNDESGAITTACGAVDSLMQDIYGRLGLGDPGRTAFAAKVATAVKRLAVFEGLKREFVELGMSDANSDKIVSEWRASVLHAAEMLQTLRSKMGDVHGTKPALRRAAYDAVKWSAAICSLFDAR